MKRYRAVFCVLTILSLLVLAGCSSAPKKIVLGFVPSQDASTIPQTVKPMEDFLSKELGIPVQSFTGTNFAAVIEGMGSKQVDVGFLNTLSYVLAHDQYGVQVVFQTVRRGSDHYRAQIIAQKSKGYKSITDLKGKKFGFVDPASTSGYLYPALMFKNAGIDPAKDMTSSFLTGHDVVAKAVYNGDVDAGACFDDCRDNIIKTMPDAKDKVVIVAYSDDIPNDTVSVRKDLPADLVKKISDAMMKFAGTDEGKATLKKLYDIDGFAPSNDGKFNVVRDVAKKMNIDLKAEVQKKK